MFRWIFILLVVSFSEMVMAFLGQPGAWFLAPLAFFAAVGLATGSRLAQRRAKKLPIPEKAIKPLPASPLTTP